MASINALRAEAEAWLEAAGRARADAAPGPADLGPVDRAHPEVVSAETARAVGALLGSHPVPEPEIPRLRLLVRFLEQAALEAAARGARLELDAERWREAPGDGLETSLAIAEAELARTEERSPRLRREAAVNRGWEALLPRAQRVQAAMAAGASALGASGVTALVDGRRDPAWEPLGLEAFLRSTEDAYGDVLAWALGKVEPRLAPRPRGDATLADLERVRALPAYPGVMENADEALRSWAARLGDAGGRARRIRVRSVPPPAAQAIAVEVPDRIDLLLPAASGAATDVPAHFFWTGVALNLASVESDAPLEHRWMGDQAVWAASGWIARGLLWHERWLRDAFDLGRAAAREVARVEALVVLGTLRAQAALVPHLRILVDSGPTPARLTEAAEALATVLRVRVERGRALGLLMALDLTMDDLRGAALASCVWAEADRRFDADEFRNPSAGRWLAALWARGAPEAAEQMAPALCGRPLGLEGLGAELVAVLGA
jgi:hypothetical protein